MILIKMVVWTVVSTLIELLGAFVIAGLLVLFFNLSGVAVLAGLGYWNLYWIQMAIYEAVSSSVVMGISAYEFFQD